MILGGILSSVQSTSGRQRHSSFNCTPLKKKAFEEIKKTNDLQTTMCQQVKKLDKLPPTRHVLIHHPHRANYQALWSYTADVTIQSLPLPIDCGWEMEDEHSRPIMSAKEPISLKDLELISCSCETECRTSRCGCADVCHIGVRFFNKYNYDGQDDNDTQL
ncbi:hypothetical protein JTB14_001544 [Gonioctena quinquepunctata]|nr:hypothetical protein JTB14_001544 [Gonioctena quinquepunctata]